MTALPDYIAKTVANPPRSRAPWYTNTAPTYAGVFLWIGFYESIAQGTLDRAGLGVALLALCAAALLSFALYYYAPAMLGMRTGLPLYVVGSSTFGARGGYLMPGLLMGLLQIGWYSVSTYLATTFLLKSVGANSGTGTVLFTLMAVVWGYTMAWIGAKGIRYVSRVSLLINVIPFVTILVVFLKTRGGLSLHAPPPPSGSSAYLGFVMLVQIVTGFFATAGAAGADFGMNSRDARDVRLGGLVGIVLAILFAGGLPLLSIAAAHNLNPDLPGYSFDVVIGAIGGFLASAMFFLYAIASVPGACFCALIAGNSFSTMLPHVPRIASMMAGVTISIILAATGTAANLVPFFQIVGASFGPICGAMLADYLLSGRKWAGPRQGINFAGYGAWAVGFVFGIVAFLPVPEAWKGYAQPATVYSALAGFLTYLLLAKAGLESAPVELSRENPAGA